MATCTANARRWLEPLAHVHIEPYADRKETSVRFIAADIPDEVFKAMCTINGGEKADLEKFAAPVTPEGKGAGQ